MLMRTISPICYLVLLLFLVTSARAQKSTKILLTRTNPVAEGNVSYKVLSNLSDYEYLEIDTTDFGAGGRLEIELYLGETNESGTSFSLNRRSPPEQVGRSYDRAAGGYGRINYDFSKGEILLLHASGSQFSNPGQKNAYRYVMRVIGADPPVVIGRVVTLQFVRQDGTGFRPTSTLVYGQPFFVEVHFDVPPSDARKEVKLEWAGKDQNVIVTKTTADPKVFRSEMITPRPPAANVAAAANTPTRMTSYRVVGVADNDQLTIRTQPGALSAVAGRIPPGATGVRALGEETTIGTATWIKIEYSGVVGWVNKRFLSR